MSCAACGHGINVPVPHDAEEMLHPHAHNAHGGPIGAVRGSKLAKKRCSHVVCPNKKCNYKGPALRTPKCNTLLALVLCLLGVIPGLVYICFRCGATFTCPECGRLIAET